MAQTVNNKFQPIWASSQLMTVGTASATSCTTLPACGAVRIASGGSPLFFSFIASASSAAGTGIMFLPANSIQILETAGSHSISFKVDTSANPMNVNVTPLV